MRLRRIAEGVLVLPAGEAAADETHVPFTGLAVGVRAMEATVSAEKLIDLLCEVRGSPIRDRRGGRGHAAGALAA